LDVESQSADFASERLVWQHWSYTCVKRCIDITLAASLLVVLSPLLGAIALLVRLLSGPPVLYRWCVVGQAGRPFTSYKFRTMVPNADALKPQLLSSNEMTGPVFKIRSDPRVTPLGRILRKYSLDELPQLWSVLVGDMSLVGPRPPLRTEYAMFSDWHKLKLVVKPGITCLWQVSGRNEIRDFDEWVRLDLEYIRKQSVWLDLKILLLTGPALLRARGAM
jgi:lipopolysaccharide/colanic/teichoic acid biosynthesis glycosyltransferase